MSSTGGGGGADGGWEACSEEGERPGKAEAEDEMAAILEMVKEFVEGGGRVQVSKCRGAVGGWGGEQSREEEGEKKNKKDEARIQLRGGLGKGGVEGGGSGR